MTDLIGKIRRLFSPEDKWRLLGVTALMTIAALMETLGIGLLVGVAAVFLKPEIFEQHHWLQCYYTWTGLSHTGFIILNLLLVGAGMVLKNIFSLFVVYIQTRFIYAKQSALSIRLFGTYLRADYRYSLDHSPAERNTNVFRAMQICRGILLPLMQIWADILVIVLLTAVMLYFIPVITLGSVGFLVAGTLVIYGGARSINGKLGQRYQDDSMEQNTIQYAGITGTKTVKAQGREEFFFQRYARKCREVVRSLTRLYTLGQLPRLALDSAAVIVLVAIFIFMLLRNDSPERIILTFSLILAVTARILPALSRCNYNLTQIRQSRYLFDVLFNELTGIPEEEMGEETRPLNLVRSLEVRNLNFSYDGKIPVIHDLSFELPVNHSLGIRGRSGCGKTTIIDILLGLLRPDSGQILTDGEDIFGNLTKWRSMIGYVPQDVFIYEGTVRENVAFGDEPDRIDDERVEEALKLAQLWDVVSDLPGDTKFVLRADGSNLSGGQRQRIGIARALYRHPRLLILDEATSALDNETEAAFVEALEALNGKITMIVVAHRLTTIERCDKILSLVS